MREGTGSDGSIGAFEAKTHLSELLERVSKGEEITITKHGSPVARLVPVHGVIRPDERRALIEQLLAARESRNLEVLKIKDLIAEGRK